MFALRIAPGLAQLAAGLALLGAAICQASPIASGSASASGSVTIYEFLTERPDDFLIRFDSIDPNQFVDLVGSGTGAVSGFATHNAADPANVQVGEAILWSLSTTGAIGPGFGSVFLDNFTSPSIRFFNPSESSVIVRLLVDFSISASETIHDPGLFGSSFIFADWQINSQDPGPEAFIVLPGESDTRSLFYQVVVPGRPPDSPETARGFNWFVFTSSAAVGLDSVPEPASVSLLLTGLGLILAGKHRCRISRRG